MSAPKPKPPTVKLTATPPMTMREYEAAYYHEPDCDCGSLYEDDDMVPIHYAECAVIKYRLGH